MSTDTDEIALRSIHFDGYKWMAVVVIPWKIRTIQSDSDLQSTKTLSLGCLDMNGVETAASLVLGDPITVSELEDRLAEAMGHDCHSCEYLGPS